MLCLCCTQNIMKEKKKKDYKWCIFCHAYQPSISRSFCFMKSTFIAFNFHIVVYMSFNAAREIKLFPYFMWKDDVMCAIRRMREKKKKYYLWIMYFFCWFVKRCCGLLRLIWVLIVKFFTMKYEKLFNLAIKLSKILFLNLKFNCIP